MKTLERNQCVTEHHLDFEDCEWPMSDLIMQMLPKDDKDPYDIPFRKFKVGTVEGAWRSTPEAYEILAITNSSKGNGHLTDTLQWFEYSARRDRKKFRILECWNGKFMKHLIKKRGFRFESIANVVKEFA